MTDLEHALHQMKRVQINLRNGISHTWGPGMQELVDTVVTQLVRLTPQGTPPPDPLAEMPERCGCYAGLPKGRCPHCVEADLPERAPNEKPATLDRRDRDLLRDAAWAALHCCGDDQPFPDCELTQTVLKNALSAVARDGEFDPRSEVTARQQPADTQAMIKQLREERDALRAEVERLRSPTKETHCGLTDMQVVGRVRCNCAPLCHCPKVEACMPAAKASLERREKS